MKSGEVFGEKVRSGERERERMIDP